MSDITPVITRKVGSVGRITLNRPEALHALTEEMCVIMSDALLDWREDDEIGVVLVDHAEGTRGFCAGGDIRMLAESGAGDGKAATDFFRAEYRLNTLIHNYPKPYVSILNGVTMGGGVGVSVHGSHRITTEKTLFAMPESGIGLFPDVGGGWFLPRLPGEYGMWLALTGARLKGSDVTALGIGTHHVPGELLGNLVGQIESADFSFEAEHLLNSILGSVSQTVPHAEIEDYEDMINTCFSADSVERILECLASQEDDWARAQVNILKEKSPLTLKVAFRQLREGAHMASFEDNMVMEYRIGARMVREGEFHEGVRAVIIDKDNAPNWPSGDLSQVHEKKLQEIFAPLSVDELTFL
ncbi:MAG: enoyl-CoA hydratase [Ponticaulis sp.]|nr:enoyl-CoA hydratase [Ponticaulis sp.]|tara:strand:+ start:30480 stop:31547 length:1068 start_codon:yes stop_codon:yes gene_type:complete